MKIYIKLVIALFALTTLNMSAETREQTLKTIELKVELVQSELNTLKIKQKLNPNDAYVSNDILNRNKQLAFLKEYKALIKKEMKSTKKTSELLKEYNDAKTESDRLTHEVDMKRKELSNIQ